MKKYFPNIKRALILSPAIFLFALWVLVLSPNDILITLGQFKLILWGLLLSFGVALSITMFVDEMLKAKNIL